MSLCFTMILTVWTEAHALGLWWLVFPVEACISWCWYTAFAVACHTCCDMGLEMANEVVSSGWAHPGTVNAHHFASASLSA